MLYCERRYAIGSLFRSTSELTQLTSWLLLAEALIIHIHEIKIKKFGLSSYLHSTFLRKDAYSIAENLVQLNLFKKPKEIKSSSINEEKSASNALLYTKPVI